MERTLTELIEVNESLYKRLQTCGQERDDLKKKVSSLFDAIKHGDEAHQQWLKDKIKSHFGLK